MEHLIGKPIGLRFSRFVAIFIGPAYAFWPLVHHGTVMNDHKPAEPQTYQMFHFLPEKSPVYSVLTPLQIGVSNVPIYIPTNLYLASVYHSFAGIRTLIHCIEKTRNQIHDSLNVASVFFLKQKKRNVMIHKL